MDAEINPAISTFDGELGRMAANISTTAPIHVIIGWTGASFGIGSQ